MRLLRWGALLSATLLAGCGNQPVACSDSEAVDIVRTSLVDNFLRLLQPALSLGKVIGQQNQQPQVSVDLAEFREYAAYDSAIKVRSCEATTTTRVTGLGDFVNLGFALNGIDASTLAEGTQGTVRYTIQTAEDGTQIVTLQD